MHSPPLRYEQPDLPEVFMIALADGLPHRVRSAALQARNGATLRPSWLAWSSSDPRDTPESDPTLNTLRRRMQDRSTHSAMRPGGHPTMAMKCRNSRTGDYSRKGSDMSCYIAIRCTSKSNLLIRRLHRVVYSHLAAHEAAMNAKRQGARGRHVEITTRIPPQSPWATVTRQGRRPNPSSHANRG